MEYAGARKTKTALERRDSDSFYSTGKLNCCYFNNDLIGNKKQKTELMLKNIDEAMRRLKELWDKNNFERGDKIRINVVRNTLKDIAVNLLGEEWNSKFFSSISRRNDRIMRRLLVNCSNNVNSTRFK